MKSRLTVAISSLMLIACSAMIGTVARAAPSTMTAQSCRSAVQTFYAWYLPHPDWLTVVSAKPPFLSAQLVQLLKADRAATVKTGDEGLDFDPFLNAQNITKHVFVGTATVHGTTCTLPIYPFHTSAQPGKPPIVAALAVQNRRWVFTDFTYDFGSDLIKTLKTIAAQRAH